MEIEDLEHRFTYHKPTSEEAVNAHQEVRRACLEAADTINELVPEGREKERAIEKLEEAMMWGNAGLARKKGSESRGQEGLTTIELLAVVLIVVLVIILVRGL